MPPGRRAELKAATQDSTRDPQRLFSRQEPCHLAPQHKQRASPPDQSREPSEQARSPIPKHHALTEPRGLDSIVIVSDVARPTGQKDQRLVPDIGYAMRDTARDIVHRARTHRLAPCLALFVHQKQTTLA